MLGFDVKVQDVEGKELINSTMIAEVFTGHETKDEKPEETSVPR